MCSVLVGAGGFGVGGGAGSGGGSSSSELLASAEVSVAFARVLRMATECMLMRVDAIRWTHSVLMARAVRASFHMLSRVSLVDGRTRGLSSSSGSSGASGKMAAMAGFVSARSWKCSSRSSHGVFVPCWNAVTAVWKVSLMDMGGCR